MYQQVQLSDTLLADYEGSIHQVIDIYTGRKFIERISTGTEADEDESIFHVQENRRPVLEYYKNNCLIFFVPAALTALAILARDAFQFTSRDLHVGYRDLQDFFANEFARDPRGNSEYHVRKTLKGFIDEAVIMPHASLPDTYNLTSSGYRQLRHYALFLKSYLESYWIVLQWFQQARKQPRDPKDRIRKIQSFGSKLYRREEVDLKEALSKINFINAVDFFTTNGIGSPDDTAVRKRYADFIQRHLKILQS
jgi:glycerol-3-phosphate O-acyltransferase